MFVFTPSPHRVDHDPIQRFFLNSTFVETRLVLFVLCEPRTEHGPLDSNFVDLFGFENTRRKLNKRQASHSTGQCATDHHDQCPLVVDPVGSSKRLLVVLGGNAAAGEEIYGVADGWRSPLMRNHDLSPQPPARAPAGGPWSTVYSKRKVLARRPNVFVSVFVPHDDAAAANKMAKATAIRVDSSAVSVEVGLEGGASLKVRIGVGGSDVWFVDADHKAAL